MRNVLNNLKNTLLDKALSSAFSGIGDSIFGGGGGGGLGGFISGLFGGKKAQGGPVSGGKSYVVGERGPEIFTPRGSGNITPNNQVGGTTNININVDASGTSVQGDEDRGAEFGEQIAAAVKAVIVNEKRVGGLLE